MTSRDFMEYCINRCRDPEWRAICLEVAVEEFLKDGDRDALEMAYRDAVEGRERAEKGAGQP